MKVESITFQVRGEPQGPVLKVTHHYGVADKTSHIDWYKREDGRWVQSGIAALDSKYDHRMSADWATVPDALLRAMGLES